MQTLQICQSELEKAADLLLKGEVVAFPTETVYGLGASLFIESAVQKIFYAKGRPSDNPLIAHIHSLSCIEKIAQDIPPLFYELAHSFWPGPLTIILPKRESVPLSVSAGLSTVAVRMPSHPIARKLIELVGDPLVGPSANRSGRPSATNPTHVWEDFEGKIAGVILGGDCVIGIESTVVRLHNDRVEILRPGALSLEELKNCVGDRVYYHTGSMETPASPGMKYRHYAPNAKVYLFSNLEEAQMAVFKNSHKKMVLANGAGSLKADNIFPLNPFSFYASLRKADLEGYQEVLILLDPQTVSNRGFINRIEKSAGLY